MSPADSKDKDDSKAKRARRLLVALDATRESAAALEAAADLAARMRIELQGLFIEDQDLLDLAHDPLVRSFDAATGRAQDFSPAALERSLRRQIAEARRAFEAIARARKVHGTFEVRRGRAAAEIVARSEAGDMIVVTRSAAGAEFFPIREKTRPGAIARALVAQTERPVLIVNPGAHTGGRVFVAYDGTPSSRAAIEAATQIADRRGGGTIGVLIAAKDDGDRDRLQEEARQALAAHGYQAAFQSLPDPGLDALCSVVSNEAAALLVLGADQPMLAEHGAEAVLDRISCSVLVVR